MAQHALPPGAARRRSVFGLLDADGWSWATLKATFWFLLIIFLLGYVPNLAYYFTVSNTVDVGYNFLPIINWCPTSNEDLDCPAPTGAFLPWQASPAELALPSPRSGSVAFQSGTLVYLIGGTTAAGATDETLSTVVTLDGNFAKWAVGPGLPEPRTHAVLAAYAGVPYVIGGLDAAGEPTDTVFMGTVEEGKLTGWVLADGSNGSPPLTLKQPISDAGAVVSTNGIVLLGGRDANGPVSQVYTSTIPPDGITTLRAWQTIDQLPLPEPRAGAVALGVGETVYVAGGDGPTGPTASVFRLTFDDGVPAEDEATGEPLGWQIAPEGQMLPAARSGATGLTANGVMYVMGGVDATGTPQPTNLWAIPDTVTGDLNAGWESLDQTQLVQARALAPLVAIGSTAFLIGGEGPDGATDSSQRAGMSPKPPYFRLGLFGATVPALSIKGEIGQQLGYMNAAAAGTIDFVILVLVGIAFSHQRQTLRFIARLSRGRLTAPTEDEYTP